jgi:hypothetical protein
MRGPPDTIPTRHAWRRDAARRMSRRVVIPAFVVSAVVHAAALFLIVFEPAADSPSARSAPELVTLDPVMRAYDIEVVAAAAAPIETQLRERQVLPGLAPEQRAWSPQQGAPTEPAAAAEAGTSVRDRLQYRMGSAEVWRPQAPLPAEEMTPDERVRARVASQLQEYNDSVAAEALAAARATDWTVKDGNGGRWGVSPGALHLGSVTVPLPFELSTPPGRREEVAGRIRSWTEIQDQAARVEGREILDERIRAMRERADQERANRGSASGSTTPAPTQTLPPATGGGG